MRSRAYPSNDLATAVHRLELYNTNLGVVGYHARDKIAVAIGYKGMSGPASRAIASLVHYGLLERRKDKYGISELAKSILLPHNEGEAESAIREAAVHPNLFGEIVRQYQGQELPTLLGNILTSSQYGISPKAKDEVVEVFKATMEYAGLLQNNRLLTQDTTEHAGSEHEGRETEGSHPAERPSGPSAQGKVSGSAAGLTELPSGISIAFPSSLGFAVVTGEFGNEIKNLERKAQALLGAQGEHDGQKDKDSN